MFGSRSRFQSHSSFVLTLLVYWNILISEFYSIFFYITLMNEAVIAYVQNQIAQSKARLTAYAQNSTGKLYPKRNAFIRIEKYIKDFLKGEEEPRWIIVPGLRGVGKTTILAQSYLEFVDISLDSLHILYVSIDEVKNILNATLKDVIEAYEQILGVSFEKLEKPILLLIDEVQYDEQWAAVLKSLYDRSKKVCVICSGSSAVSLQSNPDVIRRAVFEKLYPMSFCEFQMIHRNLYQIKDLKKDLKQALYFSNNAEEAHARLKLLQPKVLSYWAKVDKFDVQKYLDIGTLPFALRHPNQAQVYESINLLLDKIILHDIQTLGKFSAETLSYIKRLLYIMAETVDILSIEKLTKILPLDRLTIASIFDVLTKAEMLIKVQAHGSNMSRTTQPAKYYFMTPAIRLVLLSITGSVGTTLTRQGRLLEDVAALHFYREFIVPGVAGLTYDASSGGADFILEVGGSRQLTIEIGTGSKSSTQVKSTMDKIKCNYGIVISSDPLLLLKEENILKVPLPYFLLI